MRLFITVSASILIFASAAYCFDVTGLQPTQPNGVFSTFSTSTNPAGVFAAQFELQHSVDPTSYQVNASFSCAIADSVEFSATMPYHLKTGNSGFEDVAMGIKDRLIEEGEYSPSIAALVSGSAPSGRDVISTNGRVGGGLIMSKKVGPFKTSVNALIYAPFRRTQGTEVDFMLGAELPAANNLSILTEIETKKSNDINKFDYWDWKIGYRFRPLDFLYTTLSAGYGFKTRFPDFHVFLSFTLITPPADKILKYIYEEEKD